jgi:hypothetical protein
MDPKDPEPVILLRPTLHEARGPHGQLEHEHERIPVCPGGQLGIVAVSGIAEELTRRAGDLHVVTIPPAIVAPLEVAIA